MVVKEGYKNTEVGVIPEDWELVELGEICSPSSKRIDPINCKINYKCIELEHLSQDTGRLIGYANSKDLKSQKTLFLKEDVLFGKLRPYLKKYFYANFDGVCTTEIWVLKKKIDLSNIWLYYIIQSDRVIEVANQSTGTKMPRAEWNIVGNIIIPFPPLPEQTAIATVLSDTDNLIQALEKKIAKKEMIKKGAMQELLEPKEGWEKVLMPEVCWFQEGPGVRNYQFTNSGVKLLNGTNIEKGKLLLEKTERYISNEEAFGWYSHFLVDEGDILIACSGVSIEKFHEKVTFAESKHLPLCMNTSTMRFKIKSSEITKDFLFHFLKSNSFKEQIGGKATGSAQLNFGPSHVSKVYISMPSRKEQFTIAQILSDIDTEIESLQDKLSKYKQLKQGLMQELLTGRIRLV